MTHRFLAPLALLLALAWQGPARAETFATCSNFITSLPAVITTQGTWCLDQDLSTAITSGVAIDIQTNNVTIDCNDFKVGGLAAGSNTGTYGILGVNRLNISIRNCNIRGFVVGVYLGGSAGGGHLVQDNRLDGNTNTGIRVDGDGSTVRGNRISDSGGSTNFPAASGIVTNYSVDIIDNTVSGVAPSTGNSNATGISTGSNSGGTISGNRIRGLVRAGTGLTRGIYNSASGPLSVRDNNVFGDGSAGSVGMTCSNSDGRVRDNVIHGFLTGLTGCTDVGGNDILW